MTRVARLPTLGDMSSSERVRPGRSAFLPGFELHPIMLRAALATSRQWRDAIVEEVDESGVIRLRALDDGSVIRVWNYLDNAGVIAVGAPVAVHERFGVLASGALRLSVRFD